MTELFEVQKQKIGNETVNAVNARDLWNKLKSKQDFSTWIKSRIEKYGFVENVDYLTLHKKVERQKLIEYFISIDMAKELSMIENNDAGKIAKMSQSRADFEANCARAFLSAPLQLNV